MRVLSSSLTGLVCIATLMAATATPGSAQPSAMAFEGKVGGVQLIDGGRATAVGIIVATVVTMVLTTHRMPYGPYYGPYYYPYYRPYYGPSVSFSFGF